MVSWEEFEMLDRKLAISFLTMWTISYDLERYDYCIDRVCLSTHAPFCTIPLVCYDHEGLRSAMILFQHLDRKSVV